MNIELIVIIVTISFILCIPWILWCFAKEVFWQIVKLMWCTLKFMCKACTYPIRVYCCGGDGSLVYDCEEEASFV